MFVLTRRESQKVVVGKRGEIVITAFAVAGNRVLIGVQAPPHTRVRLAEREFDISISKTHKGKINDSGSERTND